MTTQLIHRALIGALAAAAVLATASTAQAANLNPQPEPPGIVDGSSN